ncbi:hypothetical protein BH24DEI2_BH24DEI2_01470 [soil metagenome]
MPETTDVTLYGTAWCEVTRELRIFLNAQKVPYTFKNVENDVQDKAAALTLKGGEYYTPVVVVGERAMLNPAVGVLERELRKQGLLEA